MRKETQKSINRIIVFLCAWYFGFSLFLTTASAEGYEPYDGDGWRITSDGVMTIESNQGWWNAMKNGFVARVHKLVIGKDLTQFRVYCLPYDLPSLDFFSASDIAGYDKEGNPYYDYLRSTDIYPTVIEVEAGNPVFRVIDGLLINTATGELVLSETRVSDAVIPEGVKTITRNAFNDRAVRTISFPSSLEHIGEGAFSGCNYLESVVIPNSRISIGSSAFSKCTALKNIALPEGLQTIEAYTFNSCAIEYIDIPDTVYMIDSWAFLDCEQLKQIELPQGLNSIGFGTFIGCSLLARIDLPEGLESIGEQAFFSCYDLQRVILPDSLQRIGNNAFWGCELSILKLPDKLEFVLYGEKSNTYKANPHATRDKAFGLSSVDTVIFTGSDYDFGYHAITDAKHVYFLSTPPEEVGEFLDKETVEHIYCSDEYEFEWTRSKVASWVRQKLTILPAAELHALVEEKLDATPTPLETPAPTPSPTPDATPIPTRKATPAPTATPTMEQDETGGDPLLIVFAGVLALVVAGIVIVSLKKGKKKRRRKKN